MKEEELIKWCKDCGLNKEQTEGQIELYREYQGINDEVIFDKGKIVYGE